MSSPIHPSSNAPVSFGTYLATVVLTAVTMIVFLQAYLAADVARDARLDSASPAPHSISYPDLAPVPTPAPVAGDDNGDGYVAEDESGWDCATMGNRVCGPAVWEGPVPIALPYGSGSAGA